MTEPFNRMENSIDSDDDKTISIGARMAEMSAHLRILLNREQKWIEGQNDLKEMILNQQDQINSIINGGLTTSPVPTSDWEKTFMEALPTDGPAKFSGNGKKVPEFLASVETYFTVRTRTHIHDDRLQQKLTPVVLEYLEGDARTWYLDKYKLGIYPRWDVFKDEIRKRFVMESVELENQRKFVHLRMKSNTTMDSYITLFQRLMGDWKKLTPDQAMMLYFRESITLPDIQQYIKIKDPKTFEDLLKAAREGYELYKKRSHPTDTRSEKPDSKKCSFCRKKGHDEANCWKKQPQLKPKFGEKNNGQQHEAKAEAESINEINNGIQEEPLSDVQKLRQQMVQLQAKVNKIGAAPKPKNI